MKWLWYVQEANKQLSESPQDYRAALRKESIHKTQIPRAPGIG